MAREYKGKICAFAICLRYQVHQRLGCLLWRRSERRTLCRGLLGDKNFACSAVIAVTARD